MAFWEMRRVLTLKRVVLDADTTYAVPEEDTGRSVAEVGFTFLGDGPDRRPLKPVTPPLAQGGETS